MGSTEVMLEEAGFTDISVEVKEESREVIAQWMPGSGAEVQRRALCCSASTDQMLIGVGLCRFGQYLCYQALRRCSVRMLSSPSGSASSPRSSLPPRVPSGVGPWKLISRVRRLVLQYKTGKGGDDGVYEGCSCNSLAAA